MSSCEKGIVEPVKEVQQNSTKNQTDFGLRLEQISFITQAVMKDKTIAEAFKKMVLQKSAGKTNEEESIYFKEIVDERLPFGKEFCQAFKAKYFDLFNNEKYFQSEKFQSITDKIKKETTQFQNTNTRIALPPIPNNAAEGDIVFMTADGTQIYFPYSENFVRSTETPAFTYDPGDDRLVVTAFIYERNPDVPRAFSADENYAMQHPVYVINVGPDEAMRTLPYDPPPPPPVINCYFQNYNTVSDYVDDRYVVSNSMPKIKLTENYRSWFGGGNYLRLYQAFAVPRNMNIDPNTGLLPVADTSRLVVQTSKLKRNAKGNWVDFNQIWNGDWRLIQFNNAMAFAYKGGWFSDGIGDINYEVSAGVHYDTARRSYIPSYDFGAKVSGKIELKDKWFLDGSDYISRRDMLAHTIGNWFNLGTAKSVGADPTYDWTVRPCGKINYYFYHTICY